LAEKLRRPAVHEENIVEAKMKTNPEREHRISMEIIVDAYNEYEQALGWYYYLKDNLQFPFTATCVCKRAISPLQVKDEVEVACPCFWSSCYESISQLFSLS